MKDSTSSLSKARSYYKLLFAAAFWMIIWEITALAIHQELLIPTPVAVIKRLAELSSTGLFWLNAGVSLIRIFCGGLSGILIGSLLAILTTRFPLMNLLLSPMIRIIRATPVASFIILILLWIKISLVPGFISALMVMPVMWQNVCTGLSSYDEDLLEMSFAYELSPMKRFRHVFFPALKPHLFSGICTGIGLAWKSGVAAEVLCLPKAAIGTQVYYSKIYLETPSLFAWTIVVVVLSLTIEKLIRLLLKGGKNT